MTPDPDREARRALRRQRTIATALLLAMAGLAAGSFFLPPSYPRDLLAAAAKAGFIGGIADWFAVVALFRHPLGLPIPHTAIIPREKARLGQALGRFVSRHVVTAEEVNRLLGRFDVAGFLRTLLADPETSRSAAAGLARALPRVLASLEDGRARRLLVRLLPRMVGGPEAGRVVARALRGVVEGGRHQDVLDFVLTNLRDTLRAKEAQLHSLIAERVREQGGRLVGWAIGAAVASRVLATVNAEFDRIGPENAELRAGFDEWVRREIARMETDPERAAEIGRALRAAFTHPSVAVWGGDVWHRLRGALEADAARPGGHTVAVLDHAVSQLGTLLDEDEDARARVQRLAERAVRRILPAAQAQLASFIADVIAGWDTRTITERLELRVGRDLQYVRMNGTLVGFLVGGALFAALHAIFGQSVP